MEIVDAGRYHVALKVLPRAVPDAIAGVDGTALSAGVRAEIGAPSLAARSRRCCQRLAVRVRAGKAAEVAAFAGATLVTKKVMLGACWAWVGAIRPRDNSIVEARMVKRGFALFIGKAGCSACHSGRRFTDDQFHDIGTTTTDLVAVEKPKTRL